MIRYGKAALIALACSALSGCGVQIPDPLNLTGTATATTKATIKLTGDPFTDFSPIVAKLVTLTEADVQAALADAKAQKDPVGELCWQTVLDNLPAIQSQQQAKAAGLALGLQLGRDLQTNIPRIADACQAVLPTGLASIAGGL